MLCRRRLVLGSHQVKNGKKEVEIVFGKEEGNGLEKGRCGEEQSRKDSLRSRLMCCGVIALPGSRCLKKITNWFAFLCTRIDPVGKENGTGGEVREGEVFIIWNPPRHSVPPWGTKCSSLLAPFPEWHSALPNGEGVPGNNNNRKELLVGLISPFRDGTEDATPRRVEQLMSTGDLDTGECTVFCYE